ncbi:MAG: glycosyltransferase [Betaproteobacteria bacterium]|nr:glycosyltransferase [Betaproteobacteria bacterium]
MRILHIGKYFAPVSGGMERFLGDLVGAQRAAGHEVAVLVHGDGRTDPAGDPPWLMRCPVWFRLVFAPISPAFPAWLRRAIRRHAPEVLHLHLPNPSAFWALFVPSARRIPWVVHWHSDVEPSTHRLSLRLAYPFYRIFERAVLERAECVIATSPPYRDTSLPLRPWLHKCRIVPLGLDPQRLPEVTAAQMQGLWQTQGLRALAVGRLTYYKGFETVVRAALAAKDVELVIVGEGEERAGLERLLARSGRPARIRLAGEVGDETLCRLMASCDVLCLPSLERTEAFGVVLLEAMRYAKPLLVSDFAGSGFTWVARRDHNAILAATQDAVAWREALEGLARDPGRRETLGRAGAERFHREFTIANVASQVDRAYVQALDVPDDRFEPASRPAHAGKHGGPDRLLVVMPALNEADCIARVIAGARVHEGVDVLVVDDGSTDDTAAIARASGATVLRAPLWQGAWGAIQTGLRYAVRHGYAGVVTMDADGQHQPEDLPRLRQAARDADVVIAACPSRGSALRYFAWAYFKFLTGLRIEDLTSGFRYYNAQACRLLAMEEATLLDYQDIGVLLLLRHANLRIAEIPVAMNRRVSGASRVFFSWWTVGRYMLETSLLCLARWNRGPGAQVR